jgi:SPP1 family predicted phage head-tail adaptor
MIAAGKLNRRIEIQKKTLTTDADGYKVESWEKLYTPMAYIQTVTGREFHAGRRLLADANMYFIIWYKSGITTQNRIKYNGKIHEILSVEDVSEAHREMHIVAKELMPGG